MGKVPTTLRLALAQIVVENLFAALLAIRDNAGVTMILAEQKVDLALAFAGDALVLAGVRDSHRIARRSVRRRRSGRRGRGGDRCRVAAPLDRGDEGRRLIELLLSTSICKPSSGSSTDTGRHT
jgi:hypothetical protein